MKIVLLVSSMHAGGAERVAATLVNAWSARGDEVTLVPTFSSGGDCFYPISDTVELIWLADYAGTRNAGRFAAGHRLLALRRLIREKAPDVVVSFLTNVNVAAILATWGLKTPVIVCERTNPAVSRSASGVWRTLRRWLYPRADMVTVQADATVAPFSRLVPGIRRLAVIPNPLPQSLADRPPIDAASDLNAAQATSADLNTVPATSSDLDAVHATTSVLNTVPATSSARKRLMAMGRMVPDKQFDVLIDCFAALAPKHPDWDLWIWGEGPEREALADRVLQAGLLERIQLPGRTDMPWDELACAQGFVLSSAVEGFPNVLLEAMALGLPCVAFDCPSGPREMTRDGADGMLVPAGDAQALQNAMQALMSDAGLRADLGARAAQAVRRRYALPAVLDAWDALFAQVGATRHGADNNTSEHAVNARQGNT